MAAKKKGDARVKQIRWTILGFIGAIIIIVTAYGLLYSTGVTEGTYVEGEHYQLLDTPIRRRAGDPVDVVEFFSYGCVHCRDFDPLIEDWKDEQGDTVSFRRQPVAFSPIWTVLGRTYITLEALDILDENHTRVFRAVHDQRKQFLTAEMMADFIDGNGTDRDTFLEKFNSSEIRTAAAKMDSETRRYGVNSVPTLIVGGKYIVNMGLGRKLALDIVNHLVLKIQADETAATAG